MSFPTEPLALTTYLTVQLQEILDFGDGHVLTYAPRAEPDSWFQISVHGGAQWHVRVQFTLPDGFPSHRLDRLFRQVGWEQWQADQRESRIYFLGRLESLVQLCQQAAGMASQISSAMQMVWDVRSVGDILLLGARGPQIALVHSRPKTERLALPRAA